MCTLPFSSPPQWVTAMSVVHAAEVLLRVGASHRRRRATGGGGGGLAALGGLLDRCTIHFVPLVNPDGFEFSRTHKLFQSRQKNKVPARYFRKNRNPDPKHRGRSSTGEALRPKHCGQSSAVEALWKKHCS